MCRMSNEQRFSKMLEETKEFLEKLKDYQREYQKGLEEIPEALNKAKRYCRVVVKEIPLYEEVIEILRADKKQGLYNLGFIKALFDIVKGSNTLAGLEKILQRLVKINEKFYKVKKKIFIDDFNLNLPCEVLEKIYELQEAVDSLDIECGICILNATSILDEVEKSSSSFFDDDEW